MTLRTYCVRGDKMYQVYFLESITLDLCTAVQSIFFYFISQSVRWISQSVSRVRWISQSVSRVRWISQSVSRVRWISHKLTSSASKTGGISCNTWHLNFAE